MHEHNADKVLPSCLDNLNTSVHQDINLAKDKLHQDSDMVQNKGIEIDNVQVACDDNLSKSCDSCQGD